MYGGCTRTPCRPLAARVDEQDLPPARVMDLIGTSSAG